MSVILALVAGLLATEIEVGDRCEEALHLLLTQENLQILASDTVERDILVYTLGGGGKTAILGCRRDRPADKL